MITDDLLRRGLEGAGDEWRLALDRVFQGLPDTAHGGSILAAVDAAAGLTGARQLAGVYRRRVPVATSLRLVLDAHDHRAVRFELSEGATGLVDGVVAPLSGGAGDEVTAGVADASDTAQAGHPLPVSSTCFVCGTENAGGLHARLAFDDAIVAGRWRVRETLRGPDGSLAPIALTSLLDETAFWLGALATGESGMTTDLRIALYRPVSLGDVVTVAGHREAVRPHADDPRYRLTSVSAHDDAGRLVATGEITFVAVRGAARRLVTGMLGKNPPEIVRRVFPDYAR